MLAQVQQLTVWRQVWPLLHHHHYHHHHHHHHHHQYRLLTSSAARSGGAKKTVNPWDLFGCFATTGHKCAGDQVSGASRQKLFKLSKSFPKATQGFPEPLKDSSGLSQDNILDKWHRFKDAKYQETLVEWSQGECDDVAEHFAPGGTLGSPSQGALSQKPTHGWGVPQESAEQPSEGTAGGPAQEPPKAGEAFGSLSPPVEEVEGDEGDLREERYQRAKLERRHRPHYYAIKMKRLCRERKLAEALTVLEEEMPAAGTKPDSFCYQVLINCCGRAGYTKKAFQLYNQMKKRGLQVEPVAYTGLFTACARSPWPTTDGLQRATRLRAQLRDRGYQFNQTVSHAMIMAFGRCGDMSTAFLVVDEMIQDGVLVTTETINFLLQACVTNKETGFRQAVKVWRKMRALQLKPDIYSYNLLMCILKECGAGDPNHTSSLLKDDDDPSHTSSLLKDDNDPSHTSSLLHDDSNRSHTSLLHDNDDPSHTSLLKDDSDRSRTALLKVDDNSSHTSLLKDDNDTAGHPNAAPHGDKHFVTPGLPDFEEASLYSHQGPRKAPGASAAHPGREREAATQELSLSSEQDVLPNILAQKMTVGRVIALGALDKPQDRLALLGGPAGILGQMARDRVTPDLKTVTQLLESLPPDAHAEQALLESMDNLGLDPDTQFFNMLIKRRNHRHDIRAAQAVLELMQQHHLTPDLITYGCLAMGCRTTQAAARFLRDMDAAQFRPNLQIMTILVKNSLVKQDYTFTVAMLREMQHRRTTPDDSLLSLLEEARARVRNTLLEKQVSSGREVGKRKGSAKSSLHQQDSSEREGGKSKGSAESFLAAYKAWLKGSQVELPEHPWTQYREHQPHPEHSWTQCQEHQPHPQHTPH